MSRVLWAVGILAAFLYFKGLISQHQLSRFIGYLLGIGIPAFLLFEPLILLAGGFLKKIFLAKLCLLFINTHITLIQRKKQLKEASMRRATTKGQKILSPAQIAQLNKMRQNVSLPDMAHNKQIRITGSGFDNLVPEAGIFTAKIDRGQGIENIVVMLATLQAVADFTRLLEVYAASDKNFAATGFLLPSKTGIYSVLLVTSLVFNGQQIQF